MTNPTAPSHVYVGAARSSPKTLGGIFRRADGDDRWTHLTKGLPDSTQVQAITIHPTNPDVVYLGTRSGPYRSTDRGERWERLGFPDDGTEVGCSLYSYDYRLWHKANASNAELKDALSACGPESRVGSVEGSPDPRTYFEGPATPEQTNANRLFQRCMVSRG